jgi:flagellar export protein FliJ
MKYRFRLEKILHFTRLKETVKKIEIASAVQRVEFLKTRRQSVETELRSLLENTSLAPDPVWAPFQASKVTFDMQELEKLAGFLSKEQSVLDKLRADLLRLAMRRKALEALKERRAREFNTIRSRKQQIDLDEAYRLIPKKGEG